MQIKKKEKTKMQKEEEKTRGSSQGWSLKSNDDIRVFIEGLELGQSASILCDCLQSLYIKVNRIYKLSSTNKEAQGTTQLEDVIESIEFVSEKFDAFKADRQKRKEKQQN